MTNPLLQKFRTLYQAVPFDQIKNDHFIPALKKSIQIALNEIITILRCAKVVKPIVTSGCGMFVCVLQDCGVCI